MTMISTVRPLKTMIPVLAALMLLLAGALPAVAQHEQHHQEQAAMQQADTTHTAMQGNLMQGNLMQGNLMQGQMAGMMQQHMQMMQQMMRDPLRRSAMLVHVLPTLQEPLDLSDEQVAQLKQATQQFNEQHATHQQQIMKAHEQLQEALASAEAAPDRVRTLLEETATHRAQMQALAYETAVQMKAELSAEQRTKLAEMKPMQMHHHMMAKMTMMEMMQAMQGDEMMNQTRQQ